MRRSGQVEILDGLGVGDEVVTAGQLKLRDGTPVSGVNGAGA
jgi:membrane fusion protein (multidrug efflux system)